MSKHDIKQLIQELVSGDRRALARAITLIESTRADHIEQSHQLLKILMPYAGESIRIGISGVPGVGKSTFIEAFGNHLLEQGKQVAVLAVDPSSSISGGSILGDKTRMETLSTNPRAFIRPSPAGGTLGGVARRTRESILLCEAAGFDVVIVETVGVGQSETMVAGMTDVFLLLLLPAGGDDLQGIKRGILELADIVVINKADGELLNTATRSAADYQNALQYVPSRFTEWSVPIKTCSALEQQGIEEVWQSVQEYVELLKSKGELKARRVEQTQQWMWQETKESLLDALKQNPRVKELLTEVESQIAQQNISASLASQKIIDAFLDDKNS